MKKFIQCLLEAATEQDLFIADVLDNWETKENAAIIEKAADMYAQQSSLNKHVVMQVPQFEELLQVRLDELPYTKHLDDGQFNDGQVTGFELGARWAYELLSRGSTVGQRSGDTVAEEVQVCDICDKNEKPLYKMCDKHWAEFVAWDKANH